MNYKKVYDKIIQNRLINPLTNDIYGEKHHIVPRCLGGSDNTDNLVKLTAREHFICHALLAEIYETESVEWIKMNKAFMMMKRSSDTHNGNRYFNSRLYELKRKDFSKSQSLSQSGRGNSQYGKPRSDETKQKIRNTLKQNKLNKREIRDLKLKIKKRLLYNREYTYYNNLYKEYLNSDFKSLNEFVKLNKYPYSLPNLVKSFVKYINGYEKTQGIAK